MPIQFNRLPATIAIRLTIAPDVHTVLADPVQLHQIVVNLCTNAFHAMEAHGGDLAIDLAAVCRTHERDVRELDAEIASLAAFEQDDLLRRDGARLVVTENGRLVVRAIAAAFDAYFKPEEGRHSRTL